MLNKKNFFSWFLVFGFLAGLVFLLIWRQDLQVKVLPPRTPTSSAETENIQHVKIAGKILKVDLALTPKAQAQGLSGREGLKNDESMLFVFDHSSRYPFWMKDMNFPIDIIWIGGDMRVVYVKNNALPESYPETFAPSEDAKYVLEVVAGFSEKNNLKEGDEVKFLLH